MNAQATAHAIQVYNRSLEGRLNSALARARTLRRNAEYVGHSSVYGCTTYRVKSTRTPGRSYYLHVYRGADKHRLAGTHNRMHEYPAMPGAWIECSCQAAQLGNPCVHSARLALRLAREAAQEARRAKAEAVQVQPEPQKRALRLEDLFEQ